MKPVRQRQEPYGTHLSGALASHWLCREYAYGKRLSTETQILNSQSAESPAFASVCAAGTRVPCLRSLSQGRRRAWRRIGGHMSHPRPKSPAVPHQCLSRPPLLRRRSLGCVEYNQSHGIHIPASQLHSAIRRTVTYHSDLDVRNRRISDDVSTSVERSLKNVLDAALFVQTSFGAPIAARFRLTLWNRLTVWARAAKSDCLRPSNSIVEAELRHWERFQRHPGTCHCVRRQSRNSRSKPESIARFRSILPSMATE
jgi:hypothetical protein